MKYWALLNQRTFVGFIGELGYFNDRTSVELADCFLVVNV